MDFPWPKPGTPVDQIPTPMPIINEDRLASNIKRAQAHITKSGKTFRPHIKTHKIAAVAKQQIEAGAVGINCQKISEAEVFADAGFDDILITYNIIGDTKIERLHALNQRIKKLTVVADNAFVIDGLAQRFDTDKPLNVLVECDTGARRCGVLTPKEATELAQKIAASDGLLFQGILTYPPIGGAKNVEAFFAKTMQLLNDAGIACPVRSNGGSPDFFNAQSVPSSTEHRAGTYVYNDRSMVRAGHCTADDLAMHVLATIISKPAPDRMVLDCGSKALTSDLMGFDNFGTIEGLAGAKIVSLSEEHGVVDLPQCEATSLKVGDKVKVIPNHTCVISNLFDKIPFYRDGIITRVEDVVARGKVW